MQLRPWGQENYGLRFDWGAAGAAAIGSGPGVLVVVDVLSFTTSVTVATDRGTAVHPAAPGGDHGVRLAADVDAVLAVGRREVTPEHPWSLSPAALLSARAPERLVLPSPNGSAIAAAAAASGAVVVAACLRNATAVGAWLRQRSAETPGLPVSVVAAGERWPDGSLRPALEDLLGAGAVLRSAARAGRYDVSPEAAAAIAVFSSTTSISETVRRCASGLELAGAGFAADVDIAVDLDATGVVPILVGGAFRAAPGDDPG